MNDMLEMIIGLVIAVAGFTIAYKLFPFKVWDNKKPKFTLFPKYIANLIKDTIQKQGLPNSVIICGLAYKPDIEDMRDSPGFKIISELKKLGIKTAAFDPFYRQEHHKKYLIENHLNELDFEILPNLEKDTIGGFGCMCIVQHHTKVKFDMWRCD